MLCNWGLWPLDGKPHATWGVTVAAAVIRVHWPAGAAIGEMLRWADPLLQTLSHHRARGCSPQLRSHLCRDTRAVCQPGPACSRALLSRVHGLPTASRRRVFFRNNPCARAFASALRHAVREPERSDAIRGTGAKGVGPRD